MSSLSQEGVGEGEMHQVNARHGIIREWRSLPKELRQTDEQAAAFAMQVKDKYKFSSENADAYQTVKDWLLKYLSLTRGLERNAEGEGEMSGNEKSTDPGLSAAERKALRGSEAKVAMADHEDAQKAFHGNHERLRNERLAREAAAGPMLYPAPELPDDTLIGKVRFSTRIRNALNAAGMKTIGEVREASDEVLLSLPDFGRGSIAHLRQTLGLPSTAGVRPMSKKPA
jgi:Bacterial RNA polymerase, alpha chain C terminal domain